MQQQMLLVTDKSRASAHVNPKYVHDKERYECSRSGNCFAAVVKDYLDGTFTRSQEEKIAMQTEILLEIANFRARRGWFETEIAKGTAICKKRVRLLDCCSTIWGCNECGTITTEKDGSHGPTVMEAFRSRMHAAVQARKEQEAAAQAIEEARAW